MQTQQHILRILDCIMFAAFLCTQSWAQTAISFDLMADPLKIADKEPNICFQVHGNKYLSKIGICGGAGIQLLRLESGGFFQDALTKQFSSEIRFYPLAKNKKNRSEVGCPGFNFKREQKFGLLQSWAEGFYLSSGLSFSKTVFAFYPNGYPTFNTDIYAASFEERSLTAMAGYHLRLKFLVVDLAYGIFAGKPIVNDPWKLIDENAFSIAFPDRYHLGHSFRLQVGIHF